MLSVLQNLKDKIENLPVREFLQEAVEENAEYIGQLNAKQMYAGKRADGSDIEPEYKQLTKQIKAAKGQPFDRVTLKDTGSFHKKIDIDADKKGFDIFSTDFKEDELKEKYGEKIFGLAKESKQELKDERLKEALQQKTKQYFRGE